MMAEQPPGLTELVARRAMALGDFPPAARERALSGIVDCVGCIVAGRDEPVALPLRALAPRHPPGPPQSRLLLRPTQQTARPDAPLYNSTPGHALGY